MLARTLFALSHLGAAAAHGYIGSIQGRNSKETIGFGVTDKIGAAPSFDRTLASRFDSATSPTGCGSTLGSGRIDIARSTNQSIGAGIATFATGAAFEITYVQINGGADGGGPLSAFVDRTGTGNSFVQVAMATNIDVQGRANTAHAVSIAVPEELTCAGVRGTCLFLVRNPRFGSCFVARPTKASRLRSLARRTASMRTTRRTRRIIRVRPSVPRSPPVIE